MKYKFIVYLALIFAPVNFSSGQLHQIELSDNSYSHELYTVMGLNGIVPFDAFEMAVEGYNAIEGKRKDILTLIDFSKPSTQERLYVIDMIAHKLLFSTVVSHGKNSGDNYATSFSNDMGSHKSSLGFYLTQSTYMGKHGYSLRLDGLEKGINDKAMERAIVMHSADYANPSVIGSMGRLGRSFGCPALPKEVSKDIINTIKDGSVLFVYAKDRDYLVRSGMLSEYRNNRATLARVDN